jgi:hypothetical protein
VTLLIVSPLGIVGGIMRGRMCELSTGIDVNHEQ